MDAIVLAGGLGTRLREVLPDQPKPMADINGRPFLDYLLQYLERSGIRHIILATGYLHHKIQDYFGSVFSGLQIDYSVEEEPLGTGGALRKAFEMVATEHVLVLNGDTFFAVEIERLKKLHCEQAADLTLALKAIDEPKRYGTVILRGSSIVSFKEKGQIEPGNISGGVYIAERKIFDAFELPAKFSFEEDFLKANISSLKAVGMIFESYFVDIGIPQDYHSAQRELIRYA